MDNIDENRMARCIYLIAYKLQSFNSQLRFFHAIKMTLLKSILQKQVVLSYNTHCVFIAYVTTAASETDPKIPTYNLKFFFFFTISDKDTATVHNYQTEGNSMSHYIASKVEKICR